MKTVTAADANRQFSRVLREVAHGETFTVISRGRPIANIIPVKAVTAQRHAAKTTMLNRLKTQTITGARNWTRDELYER
jgi:prevent-host-death family protein